ncbi:amidase [Amphiplicatus metriothermophilus]|uniref:Amidase n=1 Tax=Amphiplicatus metriothermophilus TaxID=1519374 RepID=A0A239PPZ8_9PROT|nr:amidase [Amphiplicatus metriothermophilus]MBB5518480.1 amidase [Amphiplicatus metriothermophilus]SNT72359.1 amidase [Amphiplicatus metriothermophilus]
MKRWIIAMLPAAAIAACSPRVEEASPAESAEQAADYAPEGVIAKTLPEIAAALAAGETTSEALVEAYVARIERVDWAGPALQSVLALNPNALKDARASDARRAAGAALGPLDGVPILLKDNIESLDPVPTTAGALALKDNVAGRDSPLVAGLRASGAVILGKTNLSQWANFRSNDSMSGWSALGGQVRNPHMLDRNPCGSSSGSAVAVAASLAAGAVGTETNGSVICPSTVNGIVGFKPTVGLVSQEYIVPISFSQDTAGPMAKTVAGAAMMLNAMATGEARTDYVAALDEDALQGARIGVARFAQGQNADVIALFDAALEDMKAAGAELVEIENFEPATEDFWGKARAVLEYEFKATINDYLAAAAPGVATRDLDALIAFNEEHADVELALFDQSLFESSAARGGLEEPEYLEARAAIQRATREEGIDRLLAEHGVDVLVSPSGPLPGRIDPVNGDVWPAWAGAGYLAAIAGYPHLSVPMGAARGAPVGVSFIGAKDADAQVLAYGYAYEQRTKHRVEPAYLPSAEALPEIAVAMRRKME